MLPQRASGLSARELSVLHWLRDGLSNKEIARALGITEATVKVHVKAILRKVQVRNRTQVAMWASRLRIGQVPQIAPPAPANADVTAA
jgi:two-component system nitrate/nitrite response regulator NarL